MSIILEESVTIYKPYGVKTKTKKYFVIMEIRFLIFFLLS